MLCLAFRPLPCCSSARPTVPEASSSEATLLLRLLNSALLFSESQGAAVTVESQRIFNSVGDREGEADALRMQAVALCVGCNRLGR